MPREDLPDAVGPTMATSEGRDVIEPEYAWRELQRSQEQPRPGRGCLALVGASASYEFPKISGASDCGALRNQNLVTFAYGFVAFGFVGTSRIGLARSRNLIESARKVPFVLSTGPEIST